MRVWPTTVLWKLYSSNVLTCAMRRRARLDLSPRRRTVVQQGPPARPGRPPASGRPGGWSDGGFADDGEEEYPPWAGPGTGPRWADQDERERRRLRGAPGAGPAQAERGGRRPGPGEPPGREEPPGPRRPGRSARLRASAQARR